MRHSTTDTHRRTAHGAVELMAVTRSGISPRLLARVAARRHRRENPESSDLAP